MNATDFFSQTFERALTSRDMKQHHPFTFTVPVGVNRLSINFSYFPLKVDGILNLLTLTVFDPTGWRGEGHRHDAPYEIILSENQATPGFLPGAIQPGGWTISVNTHMIMPGTSCTLRLAVRGIQEHSVPTLPQDPKRGAALRPTPRGPGWYLGDLHAHTLHSDAKWEVAALFNHARERGLDFVTLSDHNTISGLAELDEANPHGLLAIGGMELTTYWGHALVLGLHEWIDWRISAARGMDAIYREATERGGLFIIAHPRAQGDPECTGCRWLYEEVMPGPARGVEVWNDDWSSNSNNDQGLQLAYQWLNQGFRLALTAGTDNHGRPGDRHYGYNVVFAADLSEAEILKAVRAGHSYLSAGPRLELTAAQGQQRAMIGDVLQPDEAAPIHLTARWADCPTGAVLEWIVDGQIRERLPIQNENSLRWALPGGSARWSLVTLRDPAGRMLALTNPIYFDGRS